MNQRVFIDSSVWIDFFSPSPGGTASVLAELLETDRAVIGKIVSAEILPFVRSEGERKQIEAVFTEIATLPFEGDDWDMLIGFSRRLFKNGVIPAVPDLLVATLCVQHSALLLTLDRHFESFTKVIPLKLFTI
jgi:predicted nucleic acid-binding protein